MQDNYPVEQSVESAERRQDASDLELENLLMKERQLQVMSKIFQTEENIFIFTVNNSISLPGVVGPGVRADHRAEGGTAETTGGLAGQLSH